MDILNKREEFLKRNVHDAINAYAQHLLLSFPKSKEYDIFEKIHSMSDRFIEEINDEFEYCDELPFEQKKIKNG